ncbi:hypothetical protein N7516_002294 [Penicillium verrucosum]|uniref:uncharacterized protein n=1 Tax=Penicillium verrucosum TaxID=60171 RepID=UPI0025458C2A|nr:uncharacterized protein N7516_002294 [Penicillium verrucosum]KAJ5942126.1 hypothetical protein N7516_002294 [Penicillium verrucosum]
MATPGRPQFFCTRPDGTLTPLIAVDELPINVTICGVSRTLNAGETQGMTSCGLATQRAEPWTVNGVPQSSDRDVGKEPLSDVHSLLLQVLTTENVPDTMRSSAQAILIKGIDRPNGLGGQGTPASSLSPVAPAFYAKNSHTGNKHAASSKKEYCSYWIRHGECDYAQQGCLYKHEMPTEFHMIEKLGLRDIPRWFREKHNVASFLHPNRDRSQLTIANQPPMRALPSPVPPVNESSTMHAAPKLNKSPPRGPANRGGHNGYGNHNQHRGGRNGAPNGHHGNNWKGTHRGGRNRNMGNARNGVSSERDSERSGEYSPDMESASATYNYGTREYGSNRVCTPATPAAVPASVPITVSTTGNVAVPMAPRQSLLDDGNSLNRNAYWKLSELTDCNQDFEDVSQNQFELHQRTQPRHVYQHSSYPSSDGGVMLPKEPAVTYDSNFGAFTRPDVPSRNQSDSNSPHGTVQMNYGPSISQVGDLQLNDNVPLNSAETRVTWGPIGGPILKRTSPPADNIAQMFGPYSNHPHSS